MNASLFKTCTNVKEIYDFLTEKGFVEQEKTDVLQEHLEGKEHKHFEITSEGGLLAVIIYKDTNELKDAEKEFKENISVNYMLLIKEDFSEYRFYKYDEGTGKTLRLRKKKEEIESVFIKKLDNLKYNDLEGFEKIFDRTEFIKEFYRLYCDAEDYLTKNIKGISDEKDKEFLAKLTIERVMFLWFLQKKGFLDSNENYFVDRFKLIKAENKNYYKDFLKKLFFNGLCKKPNERETSIKNLIGDVPYLNGGLFVESEIELKYGNSIEIENKIFYRVMDYSKINSEKNIPVINLMECKEWTIDERSGEVDKLNPEVLGYIFEKSINQKDLGAVYTPQEITTYICKNTIYPYLCDKINDKFGLKLEYKGNINKDLLEHLNKDQLKELFSIVKELRILDPAVGSGHFLVDAILTLEKIYYYLYEKNIIGWSKFEIREYIIKENLFGVDILPGAIEICKLRMFLALAETFETKQDIHPLPNIEFNFRAGNSLIGFVSKSELTQNFMSGGSAVNAITKNMDFLKKHYPKIAKKAEKIMSNLFNMNPMDLFNIRNELVHDYRTPKENKEFQIELREVINELTKAFNDELNNQFFKSIKHIFDKNKSLEEEYKKLLKNKNGKAPSKEKLIFDKFLDLKPFHWLMEFSEVIENGGFDVVIGNPPWGANLKEIEKKTILLFYNSMCYGFNSCTFFSERFIELCKKDSNIGIILPKNIIRSNTYYKLRKIILENVRIKEILDLKTDVFVGIMSESIIMILKNQEVKKNKVKVYVKKNLDEKINLNNIKYRMIDQESFLSNEDFIFNIYLNQEDTNLLQEIENNSNPLYKYVLYSLSGISAGDENKFVCSKKINSKYKPIIRGKNIKKWFYDLPYEYIFYDKNKLHRARDENAFVAKEKLVSQHVANNLTFAYDDQQVYCMQTVNLIVPNSNFEGKFLISLLNSHLMNYYYEKKFNLGSSITTAVSMTNIRRLPIKVNQKISKVTSFLTNLLLLSKKKVIIIIALEDMINLLVYELYFSDKFKEDGMPTHLAELVEPYIFDIDKIKSDEEKLKKIEEFVDKIQKDKKIQAEIEKIKSHPWVKIIEEETK